MKSTSKFLFSSQCLHLHRFLQKNLIYYTPQTLTHNRNFVVYYIKLATQLFVRYSNIVFNLMIVWNYVSQYNYCPRLSAGIRQHVQKISIMGVIECN